MSKTIDPASMRELQELTHLIKRLRAPDGCPWDRKQTMQDMGKYILDEAYELFDALAANDSRHIREELGDLLFLILFTAEIAAESGEFTPADVMKSIKEKMIRRHPHVFGDVQVHSVQDVKDNWQEIKKQEKNGTAAEHDIFSGIPRSLPALKRAQKITAAASRIGFDWPDTDEVLTKLKEELGELAIARGSGDARKVEEETGDILFTLVNFSRFIDVDAEQALTGTIDKFLKRFHYVANELQKRGRSLESATLSEMDALWNESKEKRI